MTSHRPDRLTPEERELADRLGRIAPRGAPSATLDARILGAAHAAAGRKASPSRSRSRWPAVVGIAATVALAVGVVWQLRPVREVPTVRDEVPSSAVIRPQAPAAAPEEVASAPESGFRHPTEPRTADIAAARPPEPRGRMLSPPAPQPSPPVVFDDPSPVDAPKAVALPAPPAPPPPPPPAPPAPVMDAPAAAPRTRLYQSSTAKAARVQSNAAAAAKAGSAMDDALAEPATLATSRTITIADVPVDRDRTLAAVDWIERIRQRRDSGDLDGARVSLDALQKAHPALALPEDVLAIAATPATRPER